MGEIKGGHRQLMLLMLKQVLKLSQSNRDICAVVFDTFIVKSSLGLVESIQKQTKSYAQQVKKIGKKHQLGSPHVWAYGGLVSGLLEKHTGEIGAKNKGVLEGHKEGLEMLQPDEKHEVVQACRLDKTFQQDLRRITICIRTVEVRNAVINSIEQLGGERKSGRAPRGNMEREIQQWVDGMVGEK